MPNVKSPIYSAFCQKPVFAALNYHHCPLPALSWAVDTLIMFSPYGHIFHCSTHCICGCGTLALSSLHFVWQNCQILWSLVCVNLLVWSTVGPGYGIGWVRSIQLLLVGSYFDILFLHPWFTFPSPSCCLLLPHLFLSVPYLISLSLTYIFLFLHFSSYFLYLLLFSFILLCFCSPSFPAEGEWRRSEGGQCHGGPRYREEGKHFGSAPLLKLQMP